MRHLWIAVLLATAACNTSDTCAPDYCTGTVLHTCDEGEGSPETVDVPCSAGQFCVVSDGGGQCAAEPAQNPACANAAFGTVVCDGANLLTCGADGYAITKQECGGAELCDAGLGACLVHTGVDAECQARHPPEAFVASYCDGNDVIGCKGDFAVSKRACGGGSCYASTQVAECVGPESLSQCPDMGPGYPYYRCDASAGTDTSIECLDHHPLILLGCSNTTCFVAQDGLTGGCQ